MKLANIIGHCVLCSALISWPLETPAAESSPRGLVNSMRLESLVDSGQWMSVGRTYDEQHFSPLSELTPSNIAELKLNAFYDIPTRYGQEATPLVVDGIMYFATDWSVVKAIDADSGKLLWSYDPHVARALVKACCGPVNRGVAVWQGRVYVGALDGRLIALDAATGTKVWETATTDPKKPYTITGAPRIIRGRVFIGNGGADVGAVRGYVSAYDADTGRMIWRFYTVPPQPGKVDHAASDKALREHAAPTWFGDFWKYGGGGTVWDSMAYDPKLDLLYVGTGNGTPWNQGIRSAGHGDNLFLSCIVALRAKTGEYVWHYQTTPGESWDFTAAQQLVLADIKIAGRERHVLMQAPKNGYYYVLDRATGELLSATAFAPMTWSTGFDMKSGRPIENPDARFYKTGKGFLLTPSGVGAHSWQSMSFNPSLGLTYIPVQQMPVVYLANNDDVNFGALKLNMGTKFEFGNLPENLPMMGWLAAWDPVNNREVWRVPRQVPWNGGVLSTAGNLVFQGDSQGQFAAYAADSGRKLWAFDAQAGIIAAPISYSIGGQQYIAILVGWGGNVAMVGGVRLGAIGPNRLLIFKRNGAAVLPAAADTVQGPPNPPRTEQAPINVAAGAKDYLTYCGRCHGAGAVSGGVVPDLRYSGFLSDDSFYKVVLEGLLADGGMASFGSVLDHARAQSIRSYLISESQHAAQAANTAILR